MLQFLRYCLVGVVGFLIDAGILTLLTRLFGVDLYSGRVVSYLLAATATWALNRRFTFEPAAPAGAGEWTTYLLANGVGALVNYGIYALAVTVSDRMAAQPALAVALGSIAGLAVNFLMNKHLVFRSRG